MGLTPLGLWCLITLLGVELFLRDEVSELVASSPSGGGWLGS